MAAARAKTAAKAEATTNRVHAFGNDVLADHDAVALAELIRKGDLKSVEVTEAAIARARKVNGTLNAIEHEIFAHALLSAESRKPTGVFGGVPTFVKDNADMQGLPTRSGTRAATPHVAKKHGPFTEQYLAQGFTVLGKSSLPEFGFNASTEFEEDHPTRNPWNPEYSPGGSSGGSAALVAAGVVPIAHANDGGGSIRVPAACCGLIGLKPTRNRHRNNPSASTMPINIVSEGVVTRSVRDTAAFMAGLEVFYRNPKLPEIGRVEGPGKKRLKIGLIVDSITGTPTCDETRAVVNETAKLLESLGHEIVPMPLPVPKSFLEDFTLYWAMLAFLLGTFGKFVIGPDFDPKKLDPFSKGLVDYYRKRMLKTPGMLYRLNQSENLYKTAMRPYDAVLSPVLGHVVPKLGHLNPGQSFDELYERLMRYVAFTPLNNAAGSPAISLPMGVCANDLPIAVQFQAAHGNERTLLEIAYTLEAARPWRKIAAV
ncbi:MAG: amidase [Turneriella sp.]